MFYLLIMKKLIQLNLIGKYYTIIIIIKIIKGTKFNLIFFNRSLLELNENERNFQCGTVTCTFVTDSGEFIEFNNEYILF